jgi:uncharacterized membrane protein
VEIDFLGQNKKWMKGFTIYILVIQLFMTVIGISFLGVYIGNRIQPEGNLMLWLGTVGLFVGIILSIFTVIHFLKMEARSERRS